MTDVDPTGGRGEQPPSGHRPAAGGGDQDRRHPAQRLRRALTAAPVTGRPDPPRSQTGAVASVQPEARPSMPPPRQELRISGRTVAAGVVLTALVAAAITASVLAPGGRASPPAPAATSRSTGTGIGTADQPPAPTGAAIAFDPAENGVILFGGSVTSAYPGVQALSDTWLWSGGSWSELHPASSPPRLTGALLGYDPVSGVLVLTGGQTTTPQGQLTRSDVTWTWDGSTWSAAPDGELPEADTPTALAADDVTEQLILITAEGCAGTGTWRWEAGRWIPLQPATSPAPAVQDRLAFDLGTGLDLFPVAGGCPGGGGGGAPAMWWWDGSTWNPGSSSAASPVDSSAAVTTWVNEPLLVAPTGTYTWIGGGAGHWTRVADSPVTGAASVAASVGEVLLFGGGCAPCESGPPAATWIWDGAWASLS